MPTHWILVSISKCMHLNVDHIINAQLVDDVSSSSTPLLVSSIEATQKDHISSSKFIPRFHRSTVISS